MKWIVKAFVQKVFSFLPYPEKWNYFFQRRITKTLSLNEESLLFKVKQAVMHFDSFLKFAPSKKIEEVSFYEFGSGWDLIIPLVYYALGVNHQTLVDIRINLHFDLINKIINNFNKDIEKIMQMNNRKFRYMPPIRIKNINDLKNNFGITYLAPCDATNTGFSSQSYDFISSTSTLEHIPKEEVSKVLKECNRLLKPDGIMSCIIDLKDHYALFDKGISYYNFLKFSENKWELINSNLHYQNRLRYRDYITLINLNGFEIVSQDLEGATFYDVEILKQIKLSSIFQGKYSLEDLGVKVLKIVFKRRF